MSLIVCVLLSQNLRAVNNETLKIYDILSSIEYNSSYPFTYKGFLTEQANFLVFFFEKNYHFVGMGFLSHGTLPVTN